MWSYTLRGAGGEWRSRWNATWTFFLGAWRIRPAWSRGVAICFNDDTDYTV
ncbi:hypothetical protein PR003_g12592 [Phytophthora rubi]|uniref:Uncharacterized protein n=1 Tax=Phytophthora rubi TaxID=129364 RepID=A0A6A3M714_9STRA|nr:hypothetical protein PR002_g12219 [Phytophthora rubi]KAE9027769.1 hypothetical protein PR001_g11895 [Phytophthora rubi]KAE9336260.1 hypothetical protein PR003_g12592 [Phytophthora rubi]